MKMKSLYRFFNVLTVVVVGMIFWLFLPQENYNRNHITTTDYYQYHVEWDSKLSHQDLSVSTVMLNDSYGMCDSMVVPTIQEQMWLPVDRNKQVYVFSAYFVESNHEIIIVGTQASRKRLSLYCQYWNLHDEEYLSYTSVSQPLETKFLGEDHKRKYSSVLYKSSYSNAVPTHISIVTEICGRPLYVLPVINASKRETHELSFTVCLKPLYFNYGRAYELIEWIEIQKLLGAEKIVAYNYSIAENADHVLRYYSKQGLVEVVQWHLPMITYSFPRGTKPAAEIHSIGMVLMLQDCFLRNRQHSKFIVNVDIDEFIIPHGNRMFTWNEILKSIPTYFDVYIFRNAFFRKEWINSSFHHSFEKQARRMNMATLQVFQRESYLYPSGQKSKYIVRTNTSGYLHIHTVNGPNFRRIHVIPEDIGYVHHYRNWGKYHDKSERITSTVILDKYAKNLIENMENVWDDLKHLTMHIPYVLP